MAGQEYAIQHDENYEQNMNLPEINSNQKSNCILKNIKKLSKKTHFLNILYAIVKNIDKNE